MILVLSFSFASTKTNEHFLVCCFDPNHHVFNTIRFIFAPTKTNEHFLVCCFDPNHHLFNTIYGAPDAVFLVCAKTPLFKHAISCCRSFKNVILQSRVKYSKHTPKNQSIVFKIDTVGSTLAPIAIHRTRGGSPFTKFNWWLQCAKPYYKRTRRVRPLNVPKRANTLFMIFLAPESWKISLNMILQYFIKYRNHPLIGSNTWTPIVNAKCRSEIQSLISKRSGWTELNWLSHGEGELNWTFFS